MNDKRENASLFILGAGLVFFMLAASVVVFAPWIGMAHKSATITDINGKEIPAPKYTDAQIHGREIYLRENCWLCHSQVVRGDWVKKSDGVELQQRGGDEDRYGPISQAGESAYDTPHVYGTRRIGPDLARVGGKYADAWHLAHFLNPQAVTPGSVMPKYVWLYVNIKYDDDGNPVSGEPTVELLDLISYIQGLGVGIGDWRGVAAAPSTTGGNTPSMTPEQLVAKGKDLFGKSGCVACHGPEGRGNGAAAAGFPDDHKPANFHEEEWRFGSDDQTVQETISKGRAPYMPAHPQLGPADLAALSAFVRSLREK